jgi:2-polyprenyl-3-methyl-5-hydroxy-6-metoxy-1,4-benzoquinol methylase/ribosomal protein S27E
MKDLYMRNNARDGEVFLEVDCPLCGSKDYTVVYKGKNFRFVRCNECGVLYQNPRPKNDFIQNRYDDKYFQYEVENHKNFFNLQLKTFEDCNIENLIGGFKGKKVLDVGCATGMLLNHLKNKGANVFGVEICTQSCRYAYENFGLTIYNGTLENARYESNFFDIIHFSHLIEHLENPIKFMGEIYKILKTGGYVLVTTPREDSIWSKIFRLKWRSLIPDHLTLFGRSHLISLLKMTGFNPVFIESWGSIPIDSRFKFLKPISDRFAKKFDKGDVQFILAKKE